MQKLKNLIHKLNTDKFAAVTIIDNDSNIAVCKNKLSGEIIDEYGTADAFFESLLENGHQNVTVEPKRKNGNTFKYIDEIFTLSPEVEPAPLQATPTPQAIDTNESEFKKKKKKKKKNFFGLGAGLSMPEVISLNVKASQVDNLLHENRELKDKNARLEEKNSELKEEQLLKKYTADNKKSQNAMLLGVIQQGPAILNSLGLAKSPAGLNAPSDDNLNEIQKKLLGLIKTNEDSLNHILVNVIETISKKQNPEFEKELTELLIKNNLI